MPKACLELQILNYNKLLKNQREQVILKKLKILLTKGQENLQA